MEDSLEQFIKLTRNTKEGQKKDATHTVSQEQLITAHRKRESESRALKIVEFLIEGKLQPEVFLRCLKHINQSYYQDAVEERAITGVCGYCLCGNDIPNMPAKQFFINTKCNKVYDVTDRKNYCSNICYRASLHIKLQIDDGPLWLRKINESQKFSLIEPTERGVPGEELTPAKCIAKPVEEPIFTSISSFAELSLEQVHNDELKSNTKEHIKKEPLQTVNEIDELPEITVQPISEALNVTVIVTPKPLKKQPTSIKKSNKPKPKKDIKNIFSNIKKYVQEWITLETYMYLYGEEFLKKHIDENCFQQYLEKLKLTQSTLVQQKKYQEISRKLHLNQLVEDSFDKSVTGFKIKPVPDYKQLQEDSHNLELKVESFYSGVSYAVDEIKQKGEFSREQPKEQEDGTATDNPAILPLVDSNSQNTIRRKIYLNSISKAMLSLCSGVGIPAHRVLEELNVLVKTFKLQAHNVVFEPFLWSIIALILIKMLSIHDGKLKTQLDTKQSKMFVSVMLKQLPNADTFLQELFEGIENIDVFLKQCFSGIEI